MMLLFKWIAFALFFIALSKMFPGIYVESIYTAFVLAFCWGAVNVTIKPLISILTLPITVLTLGLFSLIVNGFLFWFLSTFVKGFFVSGFASAFFGALLLSLFGWFLNAVMKDRS